MTLSCRSEIDQVYNKSHRTHVNRFSIMSTRLFVGGLSYNTTAEDIGKRFHEKAPVEEVQIVAKDHISQGYAFVTMQNVPAAERIIELFDGTELNGRKIHIEFSREPRNNGRNGRNFGSRPERPAPRPQNQENATYSKTRVHVANIPTGATEAEIRPLFKPYTINQVIIREAFGNYGPHSYAFVEFSSEADQSKFLAEAPQLELRGNKLTVRPATERPRPQRTEHPDQTQ